jgi:CubicO group peptidase (beta-lactamase class C family)
MRRKFSLALLTAILTTLANPSLAHDRFASMDAYIKAAMAKWRVPALSIAVVKDDKVVLARGYGVRQLGTQNPVDGETLFRLASIVKTFTAASVGLLIDEGKLRWDDPVKKHLPAFELADPYMTANVTLRDMLSHRVGLETGDLLFHRRDLTTPEIFRRLKFLQPVAPFRTKWKYSNLMYLTADEVVARASGKPYDDFKSTRLLRPLGMKSSIWLRDPAAVKNFATPYRIHDGRHESPRSPDREGADHVGAWFVTSAAEMAQWLRFWLGKGEYDGRQLLAQSTVREMLAMHCAIPVVNRDEENLYAAKFYGWGLGWSVLDYRGRKIHTHAGGFGTFVGFMPEERLGVVVLSNLEFTNLPGMLMYDLLDAYLLGPDKAWRQENWRFWLKSDEPPEVTGDKVRRELEQKRLPGTSPSADLKNFAATYRSDLYGELEIALADDALSMQIGKNRAVALEHWHRDEFLAESPIEDGPWFDWLLKFDVSPTGVAETLRIQRIGWEEPMLVFQRLN